IWRIMESVPGSEAAAPTPMTMRPMTSSVDEVATAHTIEPAQKIATPRSIIFFRPKLSPSEPQISIRLPKARAYPPTTHCRSETLECNSDCTLERTALITVISRKVRKRIDSNAANPNPNPRRSLPCPAVPTGRRRQPGDYLFGAAKMMGADAVSPPEALPALIAQLFSVAALVPHLPVPTFPVKTLNLTTGKVPRAPTTTGTSTDVLHPPWPFAIRRHSTM